MRIKDIKLSWFRGAADPVSLEPNCKSMVVYGVNASGKSSFVDAVEYVINNGRIGHLSHEYSGKHQEKGIPNTLKPKDRKTELNIKFEDDSELKTEIEQDGSYTCSGAEKVEMHKWDYRRTVLRQDEVASFIHDTKGVKYSALLPLLGLHHLEVAAENLRQLAKCVEDRSKLKERKALLKKDKVKYETILGTDSYDQMLKKIERLHSDYCEDGDSTKDVWSRCEELETAINTRLGKFSTDQRRYIVLQTVANLDLKSHIASGRTCNGLLAKIIKR